MTNIAPLGHDTELHQLPLVTDDPLIQIFLDHWLSIRENGHIPKRSAVDPTKIPLCLPKVWIYGHLPDEDDFICRLAGSDINSAWGRSINGRRTSTLFSDANHAVLKHRWKFIMETPAIMQSRFTTLRDTSFKRAERLTLPLANDNGCPAFIFGITNYVFDRPQENDKDVAPPDSTPTYYALD